ncbi:hypothetical protein E2C01_074718 [Portunus trituberculatus]|uniref:Uncharacterized protein n=1 Tax=Portunus trituberculatus TaxID=210409 RepID=A0A5B7IE84_PORTR|nr:hypothetical protein [Portunus trituberculatus]
MASPLVAAMQVSPSLSSLVEVLARPWVRHMEYEEGIAEADDPVGHLMTALGLPLCSAVALLYHHILKAAIIALMTTMTWCALNSPPSKPPRTHQDSSGHERASYWTPRCVSSKGLL